MRLRAERCVVGVDARRVAAPVYSRYSAPVGWRSVSSGCSIACSDGGTLQRASSTRIGGARLAGEHDGAARGAPLARRAAAASRAPARAGADAPLRAARGGEEYAGAPPSLAASAPKIDAAGDAAPGIAAHHLARRDLHLLVGPPARERAPALGAAPGQRSRACAPSPRASVASALGEVGAAHAEAAGRGSRAFRSASPALRRRRRTSASASKPTGVLDRAGCARAAEAQQRGIELAELRRDLLGRRAAAACAPGRPRASQRAPARSAAAPIRARHRRQRRRARRRRRAARRVDRAARAHDRVLEGLQRRDLAHADVAVAARAGAAARRRRPGGSTATSTTTPSSTGTTASARGDRELEQRGGLALSHRAPRAGRSTLRHERRGTRC